MKSGIWFKTFAIALLLDQGLFAQEPLHLSLQQAVDMALERNLGLRRAQVGLQVQEQGVAVEQARFGRSLGASLSQQSQRSPSFSRLEEVETVTNTSVNTGVELSQQLSTGGALGLGFSNTRASSNAAFRLIDPVYYSDLGLNFTQPLVRGRGRIARIGLDLARNGVEQAQAQVEQNLRDLEAQVSLAYWNLFFARENLQVRQQLHQGARRVLETVRVRAEMGLDSRSSILQAEVGAAQREEEVVAAEGSALQAEDGLKNLLNPDPAFWQASLIPSSTPELTPFAGDLDQGIARAIESSPAFRQARLELQGLDLQIELARDQTRPAINLNASAGLTGLGATYADNLEVLKEREGRSWQGTLSLDVPLGNNSEAQRFQQRLLEKQRSELDLEQLRLQLVQQVREQFRQVSVTRRRSEVALLAERLAAQNVAEEEERLKLGLSTVRQVLDAQDDLAQARVSRLRAVVDYNQALIEWQRLTGD